MHTLAAALKHWRELLKLSQAAMATQLRMPLRTYQDYERGHRAPGAEAMEAFARAGIDTNWLLTGEGPMFRQQASGEDTQAEEAQWQVVKLALTEVPHADFATTEPSLAIDRFVTAYNARDLSVSEVLAAEIPFITADLLRSWCRQALRWQHRWETAPVRLAYSTASTDALKRRAAEPGALMNQPAVVAINRASLARYLAAVRPALEQNLMDRPTAASVVAELYSQDDPAADRPVLNLLTAVLRGIWRSQVENGAPVTGPVEEASAVADICHQLGLQPDDQTKGLTRSAG